MPGIAERLSRSLYEQNHFPWKAAKAELIAYGSGAAVLRISGANGDNVLRIYRNSIGQSTVRLMSIVEHYKENYELVLAWYGGMPELVLPMVFLLLESSPIIGSVGASLQPYIIGEKYDLFEDFSDNELLKLLEENDFLRKQFIYFAEQTMSQWQGKKLCYDLLGRENVVLVRRNEQYRIHIVDDGFFRFDGARRINSEKIARLLQRLERLSSLYEASKKQSGRTTGSFFSHSAYSPTI